MGGSLAITAVATTSASAQPGSLDTSFGTSGVAVSTLGGNAVGANGVTIVPSGVTGAGDIVTAGWSQAPTATTPQLQVAEFSPAGALSLASQRRSSCRQSERGDGAHLWDVDRRHRRRRLQAQRRLHSRHPTSRGRADSGWSARHHHLAPRASLTPTPLAEVSSTRSRRIPQATSWPRDSFGVPAADARCPIFILIWGEAPTPRSHPRGTPACNLGAPSRPRRAPLPSWGRVPRPQGDIVVGGSGDFAAGAPTALTAAEILSTGANAGTLDPQFGTAAPPAL